METIKFYENYIELHDEHTFWKLNNENIKCEEDFIDIINYLMELINDLFRKKFNTELYGLGRSGRHICVEDNEYNRRHYKSMRRYALKLEKIFVDKFNKIVLD